MPCPCVGLHSEDLDPNNQEVVPDSLCKGHSSALCSQKRGFLDVLCSVESCNFRPSQGDVSVLLRSHSHTDQPPYMWFLLCLPPVLAILIGSLLIIGWKQKLASFTHPSAIHSFTQKYIKCTKCVLGVGDTEHEMAPQECHYGNVSKQREYADSASAI